MRSVFTVLFVSYPESSDFQEIARGFISWGGTAFAVSPLHDKDVTEDGTPKKPHYHWIVRFSKDPRPQSLQFPVNSIKSLKAVVIQSKMLVHNAWGAVEYLTHKNAPEKYQYQEQPTFGRGWDLDSITTQEQKNEHRRYLKSLQKSGRFAAMMWIISLLALM